MAEPLGLYTDIIDPLIRAGIHFKNFCVSIDDRDRRDHQDQHHDQTKTRYTAADEQNVAETNVKTSNMGSLYKLTYQLTMKNTDKEKEMIDEIRCRNGNLEINVSKQDTMVSEL